MNAVTYTQKKENNRIGTIRRNVKASRNGNESFRFESLNSKAFEDDKQEFTAYKNAVDNYHKLLTISKGGKTLDNALRDCLRSLCLNPTEIEKAVKANLHRQLSVSAYKFSQKMTADARDELKGLQTRLESAKLGFIDGEKVSEDKSKEEEKRLEGSIASLKASNVYEIASLKQVSSNVFRKQFELFIGGFLEGESVFDAFVTIEERAESKKWTRYAKQCVKFGVSEEVYKELLEKGDADGMKKVIKVAKESDKVITREEALELLK